MTDVFFSVTDTGIVTERKPELSHQARMPVALTKEKKTSMISLQLSCHCCFVVRRGNPLYLCRDRYQKLEKLWLTHSVAEEVAHCLESNRNLLSIDWTNL